MKEHSSKSLDMGLTLQDEPKCIPIDDSPAQETSATRLGSEPLYDDPPDGGLHAWTQALMAHLVIFNTWGYIASYGVFQTYYTTALNRPPSDISWIGSIQLFLLFFIGAASGRATDAGLFLPTIATGLGFQLVGVFTTSLCTAYWQVFLSQGICLGIGHGLLFCPAMSLIPTYFSKKRALALAIAASGTATGGMIYPTVVRQLLSKIGYGWTIRVLGFIMLAVGLTILAFMRTRLPPRKTGPLVEWSAFRELTFVLYITGMFLCFWSLYFAFYYVASFARDIIGVTYEDSVSLILLMNGLSIIGRVVPAYFADTTFGPLNSMIPFAFSCGIMQYGWSGVHSRESTFAFAGIYGLTAAPVQALFPAALSSLTTDLTKTGARMGMGFTIVSFATLTGPPLAGALISQKDGGYLYAQMWGGSSFIAGCLFLMAARISRSGLKIWYKI
ncbi:MFS general substrate transporter [Eremomyces bilateralis CBS 781.70]|uniref:MFS general substrate transporter n=1 Tax=Eremomyces bilateralis CBS 781.70 TaxID=1392243 RepID=A0A6G1FT65_9PEZI|nr:MFS general substrate transporter [Eremomyces bilateralis CBS 781.70]KAF1809065.1 MFS general substrate transporter [Eremomyces bilateralis CBS 781.70]